jgi:hypothetical protein
VNVNSMNVIIVIDDDGYDATYCVNENPMKV